MAEGEVKIYTDRVWSYWRDIGAKPKMTYKEVEHAVRHFFEECKKRDIEDPSSIDFKYMFEAGLDYYETLDKIDEFLSSIRPPPPEPIEVGIDELLSKAEELGWKIREEDLAKIENVKRIEEALERAKRNAEKYRRELEIERERRKALERERAAAVAVPPAPPPPKPKELTGEEIAKLEDLFKATLYRELGRIPRDVMSEFRVELETVKPLPYEEASRVIERLALDIAERERVRRVVPVAPPEVAPAAPPVPREVVKPPAVPIEPMSFPRRLASSEINAFWRAFESELASAGLNPEEFMEYWIRFRDAWHQDWFHVLRAYKEMIDDIKARKMPRYYPRTLTPVWKNLPRDAILHLLATKVPQSMNDLIAQLNMHGVYVMPQEVTLIVKEEWKKTPRDSWLEVTPRDYIKKILGADPEDP